jgi:3'-5' exonuclease
VVRTWAVAVVLVIAIPPFRMTKSPRSTPPGTARHALDLCDALSSFSPGARATLNEISRIMGMPGKPDGIDGGQVEKYFSEGKIKEIAEYCETDVLNTYRVWLRYELFRGRLTETTHQASELNLIEFIKRHENTKRYLRGMFANLPSCEPPPLLDRP